MVSPQAQKQLALLFKAIGNEEIQVEDTRQTLAEDSKFEPYTVFKSIDKDANDFITAIQIQEFLRDANLDTYIQDLEVIFKTNSSSGDGKLVYYDFLNIILPKANSNLRRICVQREPYYTQQGFSLPSSVRYGIANVFEKVIGSFRKLELLKHELSASTEAEPIAIYNSISEERGTALDYVALTTFAQKNEVEIAEEEVFAFLKITDKDKDGKLGYVEFVEAITPVTPISPITHVSPTNRISPITVVSPITQVNMTASVAVEIVEDVKPLAIESTISQVIASMPVVEVVPKSAEIVSSQRESVASRKILTRFSTPQRSHRRTSPSMEYRNEFSCANIFFESLEKLRKYDRLAHTVRRTVASNARSRSPSPRKSANPARPSSRKSRPGTPSRASAVRDEILGASRENSPLRVMASREGSPLRVSRQASPLRVTVSHQESPLRASLRESRRESEASVYVPTPQKMSPLRRQNIVSTVKTSVSCEASPLVVASSPVDVAVKREEVQQRPAIYVETRETFKPLNTPERKERLAARETFRPSPEKTVNPMRDTLGSVTERTSVRSGIVVKNKSIYRSGAGPKTERSENYIQVSPNRKRGGQEVASILKRQIDLGREIEAEKNNLALKGDFNLLEAFRLFDADESEYITRSQLQSGLEALEVFVSKEELSILIRKLDKDADGLIQFSDLRDLLTPKEEVCAKNLINKVPSYKVSENPSQTFRPETMNAFKRAIKIIISNEVELDRLRRQLNPQHLYSGIDAFAVLDRNQDGYVTIDELTEVFEDSSVAVPRTELLGLFNKFDKDRDGRISYSDFIQETISKAF